MSDKHSLARLQDGGLTDVNHSIENLVSYMADELSPQLRRAGFEACADQLARHIELLDTDAAIPYDTKAMAPAALKEAYDRTGSVLARMCGQVYLQISQHCTYGDNNHHPMMTQMLDNMQQFNRSVLPSLRKMGLEYHEFDSLTLELESKLGVSLPMPQADKHADRRRNLPKNPQKIEMALRDCLETAREIRPLINNQARQHTLDRIVGEVSSILTKLPKGDDEISKGLRISALLSGSAKILKVGKWIRKVDLLETQQSESVKKEILRRFDDLTTISRGQEPGAHRS